MNKIAVIVLSSATLLASHAVRLSASSPPKRPTQFYIYRSNDYGVSWTAAGRGVPSSSRINALAVERSVSFAGTDDGVFVSMDDGRTWSASPAFAARVQCFAVSQGRVFAGTGAGVFVTQDRGRSWRQVSRGLSDLNVRSLVTHGSAVLAGTNAKGAFVLREDESWIPFGEGLPEHSQIFDLATKGRQVYAALYSKGLFRIESGDRRWERVGDVAPLEFLVRGKTLLAGHNPGGIRRSDDDGATWTPTVGLSGPSPIWVLGDAGPNVLAGTSPGTIVLSEDLGVHWKTSAAGLPTGAAVIAIGDGPAFTLVAIAL